MIYGDKEPWQQYSTICGDKEQSQEKESQESQFNFEEKDKPSILKTDFFVNKSLHTYTGACVF